MTYDQHDSVQEERARPPSLRITREEAIALLSLCILAPDSVNSAAERGLMKLANACRKVLSDGSEAEDIVLVPPIAPVKESGERSDANDEGGV